MPIHINLLAEQRALEEERRRDPVKRAIWIAGFLVAIMLGWVTILQLQIMNAGSTLVRTAGNLKVVEAKSRNATAALRKTADMEQKLIALRGLAANRFLWGSTLNSLQHTIAADIQMVRIKGEQSVSLPAVTPGAAKLARPTGPVERLVLQIDAKDFAPATELNHNKLISELVSTKAFAEQLRKKDPVTLKERLPSQPDPADPGRNYIPFTIECRFLEKQHTL
ncbi:MAG: hypothetical protein HY301_19735 [Verrucomicrobia bacterium]|nr:hypothetical protein [Verrucomicrobiota bacterium]